MSRTVALLALVASACQSARQAPKAELEPQTLELRAQQLTRTESLRQADAPAVAAEIAPAVSAGARAATLEPRATLTHSDTERFARLKASIERANAKIERQRPRSLP